jgi:CheY-like chemotaxis protein
MAQTLILGSNPNAFWISRIKDSEFREVPDISNNNEQNLSDYIERNVTPEVERLVIDACSIDTDLSLSIALHVRLMLYTLKRGALCGITLVSDFDMDSFTGRGIGSVVLMTGGIVLSKPEDAVLTVGNSCPLTEAEYISDFLHLIKILPQEKVEGRHSIANEWGADILGKTINGGVRTDVATIRVASSRYFKYSSIAALDVDDIKKIVSDAPHRFLLKKNTVTSNFVYLLIDDEADKGWTRVLAELMPAAKGVVYPHRALDYSELPEDLRNDIEHGRFQVIFLDLRMGGVEEDNIVKPSDFSGMKILKAIKKHNPGTQVILLTATNKSWNVKALLDAGADGYYMKESPEYHFRITYSEENTKALCANIEHCVGNSWLQDVYTEIRQLDLPADLGPDEEDVNLSEKIYKQLLLSFRLIQKATSPEEVAFAYIALEQVFELCTSSFIVENQVGQHYEYTFREDRSTHCLWYPHATSEGRLGANRAGKASQWEKVAAIFYPLNPQLNNKLA